MKILVTGGTGLIGSRVARALAEDGDEVTILDIEAHLHRLKGLGVDALPNVRVEIGDVLMPGDLTAAVRRSGATAIIHLAGLLGVDCNSRPETATHVNVIGTLNAMQAAVFGGIERVVVASSSSVYGVDSRYAELPIREDAAMLLAPHSALYGAGKIYMEKLAEQYSKMYGLQTVCLRPSTVYGPGRVSGSFTWISDAITDAFSGSPVSVRYADQPVSLIYVEDVARQFAALAKAPAATIDGDPYFNSGGDIATIRDIFEMVARLTPGARIDLSDEGDFPHAVDISDELLRKRIGYERKWSPMEVGLRQHLEDVGSWLGTGAPVTAK